MTAERDMTARDDIEALLPFYLNGVLEGDDLMAVETWLADDPAAMEALAEAEAELLATQNANEAIKPPADALARFSRSLEREVGSTVPSRTSWFARAWNRLTQLPAGLAWATAVAALAIVLAQAIQGTGQRGDHFDIAGADNDTAKMPFALVVFKADARMADINALLGETKATIAGGPTPDGVYRVIIRTETVAEYDRILGLIAAAPVAQSVISGRKPANGD